MAERRMFAKTIIDSDAFLDMPMSTQALYFHLSMRADDDGFINNPKRIQRMVGAGDDDLKLLIAKSFIITFDSGVVVIKHWRIHNYIQNDRYKPTTYAEEKALLSVKPNKAYTLNTECIHDGYIEDTQVRLGKDRLVKDRIEGDRVEVREKTNYQQIADMYNETCVSFPKLVKLSDTRKKAIKARLKNYTVDDFKRLFEMAEQSDFLKGKNKRNWSATFDWLINDANMTKVLEGNYANSYPNQRKTVSTAPIVKVEEENYETDEEWLERMKREAEEEENAKV